MLNEMDKLRNMLDVDRINYRYFSENNIEHIKVYNDIYEVVSVIYGDGTYGYESGLLEIMGLLTKKEQKRDTVVGSLTARQIYNRIKRYFNEVETKGEEQC